MADTRISDLTVGSTVVGTDMFPAVETAGVGPVKKTATQLKTYMSYMSEIGAGTQTVNYTGVLADQGQLTFMNGTSLTYSIPSNASVPYPIGSVLTIVNKNSSNLTISIVTDTLYLAGSTTTGSRVLVQNGLATAVKIAATTWIISGPGLN